MAIGTVVNTCALYGGTGYASGWIGINYLIIIAGFAIVAMVYMLGRLLPGRIAARITGVTRVEVIELMISAAIIAALIAFAAGACGVTTVISHSVTGSSMDPFQFADFYIGNLTFNTGLTLLTNVYALSIGYAIDSNIFTLGSELLGNRISLPKLGGVVSISFPIGSDLGVFYSSMSGALLGLFAPLIIMSLGMLFIQWLALPVIQATAFVIVLPIAIAARSIAYAGSSSGLRQAANSVLAIAIAAYIIYPLLISFSPCIISAIFGQSNCFGWSNPASSYIPSYSLATLTPQEFSSLGSSQYNVGGNSFSSPSLGSLVGAAASLGLPALDPFATLGTITPLIGEMSRFIFIAIFLFAMDIIITTAFAIGLSKALNGSLGGNEPLWGAL